MMSNGRQALEALLPCKFLCAVAGALLYSGYSETGMVLQIEKRRLSGGVTVLAFTGRITLGRESQQIETMVQTLLQQEQKKLILDLSGVDYIDSAGIGIVAYSSAMARQADGELRVAGASGRVLQVFQAMRLESVLAFHRTVDEALAALQAPSNNAAPD